MILYTQCCAYFFIPGGSETPTSTSDAGRKDSLSLNVEFVKVNLSRSRKGVLQADLIPGGSSAKLGGVEASTKAANSVRFSGIYSVYLQFA